MPLIQNKKILFLSLIIGFALWFYIKLGHTTRQEVKFPVKIVNLPKNKMIVNPYTNHIRVLTEGDGRSLIALRFFTDNYYEIDLAEYKSSSELIIIPQKGHLFYPSKFNIKILDLLAPDSIHLKMEDKIKKKVPVRPQVSVTPEAGFILVGQVRPDPDSVTVTCPLSLKDSVTFIYTENLEIKNINKESYFTVDLLPSANPLISYPVKSISFFLNIQPLGEIAINNIPVRLINVPQNRNLIIQPSTFSIRIRGGVRYLSMLSRDSVWGVIDFAHEQKLNRTEPVLKVHLPNDVTTTQITPSRFKIIDLDEH